MVGGAPNCGGGGVRDCKHNHCIHFSLSDSSVELSSTFTTFFRLPATLFLDVVLALVVGGGGLFLIVVLAGGRSNRGSQTMVSYLEALGHVWCP